jgi:hypothetical protein
MQNASSELSYYFHYNNLSCPTDHNLATKADMFDLMISKTIKWQLSIFQCNSNSRTCQCKIKYTLYRRENKDNQTITHTHELFNADFRALYDHAHI